MAEALGNLDEVRQNTGLLRASAPTASAEARGALDHSPEPPRLRDEGPVSASALYVIRHGESTWNAERRWTGHGDPPLTETGRRQARDACDALRPLAFDAVASSSLVRARETAALLAAGLGLPLRASEPRLDERHAGAMSGMPAAEIETRWPGLLERWREGVAIDLPDGEPWPDFVARVLAGLDAVRSEQGRLLVVAHMGVQRAIEHGLGRPPGHYRNLEGLWVEGRIRAPSP